VKKCKTFLLFRYHGPLPHRRGRGFGCRRADSRAVRHPTTNEDAARSAISVSLFQPPLTRFLASSPHCVRRLHISLTGVAGQMALDFVAFADGQSVVYSGPSAAPTTVPANCTQA
jgi:hypothetical protein